MSAKDYFLKVKVGVRMWLYYLQYRQLKNEREQLKIKNSNDTISYILQHKCSVARYGDGEFDLITNMLEGYAKSRKSNFQCYDEKLATRLTHILKTGNCRDINLIVCIPAFLKEPLGVKKHVKKFIWRCFVNNRRVLSEIIDHKCCYFDANFTRFYINYTNKNKIDYVKHLRQIWQDRDLCIIEGAQSRLGVGNDLFDNARSIERILCPAVNAFESYGRILERALQVEKEKLVLIALGQTATVLAYDMARAGYQAIDIGHVDVEYEWFLRQVDEKVPLKNKYVNEVAEGRIYTDETDAAYQTQIVGRIG